MLTRKEMKQKGRQSLKKHYLIFLAACLAAAFLASEFRSALTFTTIRSYELPAGFSGTESPPPSQRRSIAWEDILMNIAEHDTLSGRQLSEQIKQNAIEQAKDGNPMFGRSRGILSGLVNSVSSGSIVVSAVAAVTSITGSENLGILFLILIGELGFFLFWFLIQNTYPVIMRRIFLEGMNYGRVTPQRFLFLLRIKKWLKASRIMFVRYIFYTLWCLTIAGIFIKRYSYFMVPYIAAENPDMSGREAVTLSRRIMRGHKWECFVLELSFLGWQILGLLTFGLFNVLYTNPYKTAVFTQYYGQLRALAKENAVPVTELLNDTWLYEKPDPSLIEEKYADVISVMKNPADPAGGLTGWRAFFARNFGVLLFAREREKQYESRQAAWVKFQELMDDADGRAYPVRLFPVPEDSRRMLVDSLNYMRHYSVWSLIVIYLGLAIFGWLWEVAMHLITYGTFVNRGALHGPWLPIYGLGSVLILTFLNRLRSHPVIEFCAAIVLCGFLEYMTSVFMEFTTGGKKWWDYSGYFLNLNGRICAEGLLAFGIGGIAVVYILAPLIDNIINRINSKILRPVCIAVAAVFLADFVYSQFYPNTGHGITDIEAQIQIRDPDAYTAQFELSPRVTDNGRAYYL